MTLESLHILLTYRCPYECDHCFVWGSPRQTGVFTLDHLSEVFHQALAVKSVYEFYFEGGETFVYYPVLLKAVAEASTLGFRTALVSNGYWASSVKDARVWLERLVDVGLDRIELSVDAFHGDEVWPLTAHPGVVAAEQVGLDVGVIHLDPPCEVRNEEGSQAGERLEGGVIMFRGRAAETLTQGMPHRPWDSFTCCPYEALADPGRLHVDPFGNLHLCQGLVLGNLLEQPLDQIMTGYDPETHPVVGPLLAGGPAQLVKTYGLDHEDSYVDACHLCYTSREALRSRFPAYLGPDQMYGVVCE